MSARLFGVAAAFCLWPSAAHAGPDPKDEAEARRMFEQASTLAAAGRWDQACPVFAAAHALFPTGGTAMNVARCNEDAGKKAEALALYEYVIGLPDQPQERIRVAKERATALRALLEAARADAAQKLEPAPTAPPPSQPPPPPPAPTDEGIGYLPAGIAFAVGGAGLVAGAVVGGLALAQMNDVRDSCTGSVCPTSQESARDEAQDMSWGANAAFIVGGVGVAAGVVLVVVAATGGSDEQPVRATSRGLLIEF